MTAPNKTLATVTLATADGQGIVEVNALEYSRFDAAMNVQLEHLIEQWKHLAAPNSQRPARRSSRSEHKAE